MMAFRSTFCTVKIVAHRNVSVVPVHVALVGLARLSRCRVFASQNFSATCFENCFATRSRFYDRELRRQRCKNLLRHE
jgi:hypothetical protein